ncbi:RICIN domain-containing protein [Kitasatospora sp. NPDC101183]|uniref:RICIN domain-containing protein n=1 Tax=Kitasatospora sp. NPDC101183 TaxID=3364100 RepID=UPI003815DEB4
MFSIKKATAVAVAVVAAAGVVATAAPASAEGRLINENVRFYNESTNGALDASSFGPTAITWQANGTAYQDWILHPSPRGYLIESVAKGGNCLQAPANPGDAVPVVACNPNIPTQQWRLDQVGDKVVIAQVLDENLVIQATSTTNNVVKAFRDESPAQLWDVTPS